jgi:hypothetical protein
MTEKPPKKRIQRKPRAPLTEKQKAALDKGRKSWEPGQSGNPDGKPAGTRNRATYIQKYADAVLRDKDGKTKEQPFKMDGGPLTVEEAMDLAQIKKALNGDTNAYTVVKNTLYGKIPDVIQGGDPAHPINISQTEAPLTGDALKAELERRGLPTSVFEK